VDWEAQGLVSKANNFSFSKVEKKSKIKNQKSNTKVHFGEHSPNGPRQYFHGF
jgi:hypothetical protein